MPYQIDQVKRHFELHNELQDHYEDEYNEINHESLYCSRIIKELSFQKIDDRRERDQSFLVPGLGKRNFAVWTLAVGF